GFRRRVSTFDGCRLELLMESDFVVTGLEGRVVMVEKLYLAIIVADILRSFIAHVSSPVKGDPATAFMFRSRLDHGRDYKRRWILFGESHLCRHSQKLDQRNSGLSSILTRDSSADGFFS